MRPDSSTAVPATEPAESARVTPGWCETAQRLLTQVIVGRRCQRAISSALGEVQLTDTQLLVLWGIQKLFPASAGAGVGQSDLAQALGISPAQVSGLVEQLRKQSDLDCQRAPHDRRQQLWHVTESGRERLQLALQCIASLDLNLLHRSDLSTILPENSTSEAQPGESSISSASLQHGEAA